MKQEDGRAGINQLEEMLEALVADGATAAQFDDYRAQWPGAAADQRSGGAPCPLCFRGGRVALLRALAPRGPYLGAACAACGNQFYWKAPP